MLFSPLKYEARKLVVMNINTELENAVLRGDLSSVESLIKKECDLNVKDKYYGRTIIYDAIIKGYDAIVKLLCEAKANVNVQDKGGRTPLHFTAIYSKAEIAKILIEFGAVIDARDKYGNTPLGDAVFYSKGLPELILLLKEKGADPNLKNNYDVSPKKLAGTMANYKLAHLFE